MRFALALLVVGPFVGVVGCRRGDAAPDGGVSSEARDAAMALAAPSASLPDSPSDSAHAPDAEPDPRNASPETWTEAPRARVTRIEDVPALRANSAVLREHFGATPPPLRVQTAALGSGVRALLVSAEADDPKPLVLAVDASSGLLWKKDRPVAGVIPKVTEIAIAARPMGGLVLFLYDEPTHIVAARLWDPDGAPFADLQLFEIERCDALSAARWPEHGWIVVAARPGGARAQLLRETGVTAWGDHGAPVGTAWRASAPASIAADTDASWVLVQHAPARGAPIHLSTDHVLSFRYDARGVPLGSGPLDLGAVTQVAKTSDRIALERPQPGTVRVSLEGRAVDLIGDAATPVAP